MNFGLKRLSPPRAANVAALVYCAVTIALELLLSPFLLLWITPWAATRNSAREALPFVILMAIYPLFGLVMGWLCGFIGSHAYNLVVPWTGGLLVSVAASDPAPIAAVPGAVSSSSTPAA